MANLEVWREAAAAEAGPEIESRRSVISDRTQKRVLVRIANGNRMTRLMVSGQWQAVAPEIDC